jgi:hypothetical protein
MRPDHAQLAALSAMIKRDIEAIGRLNEELASLEAGLNTSEPSFRDVAAAAYVLHNIYGALENVFEQVSRTFENHITDRAQWHRELLTKMFLEIPGVRPALLPPALRGSLNDLRGFRHVFRHAYEFELDPAKVSMAVQNWNKARASLNSALTTFCERLLETLGPG